MSEGGFDDEDLPDGVGEEVRMQIAEQAVEQAIEIMTEMVGNPGQEVIIDHACDDFEDEIENIAEGEFRGVDSNHPEAVSEILDVGNSICNEASDICFEIKLIEEAAQLG